MRLNRLIVVAAILSLVAPACGGESLPTTPNVPATPAPVPAPALPGYRISGSVHGPGRVPIAGALVTALIDPAVKSSTTDSSGFFELDGLSRPTATVNVTAEGYWPFERQNVTAGSPSNFELQRSPLASGTYALTVRASGDCRHELPETLRTRTYSAFVEYAYDPWYVGTFMSVILSGANFRVDGLGRHGGFYGVPSGEGVSFVLVGDYNRIELTSPFVAVVEQATSSTVLVIAGYASLSGTLDGVLQVVPVAAGLDPDYGRPVAVCRSRAHQFVLSR
jgi:hypothetical protein